MPWWWKSAEKWGDFDPHDGDLIVAQMIQERRMKEHDLEIRAMMQRLAEETAGAAATAAAAATEAASEAAAAKDLVVDEHELREMVQKLAEEAVALDSAASSSSGDRMPLMILVLMSFVLLIATLAAVYWTLKRPPPSAPSAPSTTTIVCDGKRFTLPRIMAAVASAVKPATDAKGASDAQGSLSAFAPPRTFAPSRTFGPRKPLLPDDWLISPDSLVDPAASILPQLGREAPKLLAPPPPAPPPPAPPPPAPTWHFNGLADLEGLPVASDGSFWLSDDDDDEWLVDSDWRDDPILGPGAISPRIGVGACCGSSSSSGSKIERWDNSTRVNKPPSFCVNTKWSSLAYRNPPSG